MAQIKTPDLNPELALDAAITAAVGVVASWLLFDAGETLIGAPLKSLVLAGAVALAWKIARAIPSLKG